MKTPYINTRVQPKAEPADARVQELQALIVRERINHRNELRKMAEQHDLELETLRCHIATVVCGKYHALQLQRWRMALLCFAFLLLGLILGDALAPYDLR